MSQVLLDDLTLHTISIAIINFILASWHRGSDSRQMLITPSEILAHWNIFFLSELFFQKRQILEAEIYHCKGKSVAKFKFVLCIIS